ncbi:hypothetical protein Y888_13905 [Mixta calida B021323]|nr:hypothetical protein Y888_13905 [Mixta calida B021323]
MKDFTLIGWSLSQRGQGRLVIQICAALVWQMSAAYARFLSRRGPTVMQRETAA